MHKPIKLLLTLVAAFGLTALLFRHSGFDLAVWAGILGICLPIWLVYGFAGVTDFVEAHARATRWLGLVIIALGLAGMFGMIWWQVSDNSPPQSFGDNPVNAATLCVLAFGVAVSGLPRGIPSLRRAQATEAAKKAAKEEGQLISPRVAPFSPVQDGLMASIFVLRHIGNFALVFGPWLVLICGVPLTALHVMAFYNHLTPDLLAPPWGKLTPEMRIEGGLLPVLILLTLGVPTALVAWHRFVAGGSYRWWATLPDKAALRYLWRLYMIWMGIGIVATVAGQNARDIANFFGTDDINRVTTIVYLSALVVVAFLLASISLVLPAIALKNASFRGSDSARLVMPFRWSFSLGFVLALLPFAAVCIGVIWEIGQFKDGHDIILMLVGLLIALLAMLASMATYVTQGYVALSKSPSEFLTSPNSPPSAA